MSPKRPSRIRRELLINGRRVRISDLMEAELLQPGQKLYYTPRYGEPPYESVVTDRGNLRLADGREFSTPSAAGAAAADIRALAGWSAWRVSPTGASLHELRQQLLKAVAEEVASEHQAPPEEAEAARRRFEYLEEARAKAEAGKPQSLTVREFIRLWGVEDRDREASARIDADLANHGLVTVPDFRAVGLHLTLRLETPSESDEAPVKAADHRTPEREESADDTNDEDSTDIGLTLGNLLQDDSPLVSVSPSATFEEAITAMQINDYSQVAVLANPYTVHGAVSWESVAAAKHRDPSATFSDAIDRRVKDRVFDYDTRLLDVIGTLRRDGFIFVRDFERKITGIITAADVVHKYDETATPFFLVGEIDQELRQLLQNTFDEDVIRDACSAANQTFKSFNSMSVGQYQAVLDNPSCWAQLGWPLDRKLFIKRLDELRRVRNNVMHFNPDPVKPSEVNKLRIFLRIIREYGK